MVHDVAKPEAVAGDGVGPRDDGPAQRFGTPSPLDVSFLSNREEATEVFLIRHAHQVLDLAGPIGGFADPPLSILGEQQAQLLGSALSARGIDAVYTSPVRRAWWTATAIARHHEIEPVAVADLREIAMFRDAPQHLSSLEFMGEEALDALRQRFIAERCWDVYPYSESSTEFRRRIISAIEMIIADHAGRRVAVVCHGGVINAYVSHVLGSKYDVLFRPAHASISIVASADGVHTLYTLNDVHHLSTADGDFRTV